MHAVSANESLESSYETITFYTPLTESVTLKLALTISLYSEAFANKSTLTLSVAFKNSYVICIHMSTPARAHIHVCSLF